MWRKSRPMTFRVCCVFNLYKNSMNKTLTLLILFVILSLTFMAVRLNNRVAPMAVRMDSEAAQKGREAFRGGGGEGGGGEGGGEGRGSRLGDVNVGAVANPGSGLGAASHEGLGRYGWNAFDNSVVSSANFCHHDYDCPSNRCSSLGVCV